MPTLMRAAVLVEHLHARVDEVPVPQPGPDLQLWNWRGIDVINAHERDPRAYLEGMRLGVEAIIEGILDLGPLLTHRVPLGQREAAFQLMRDRPEGFLKAVIVP